MTRYLVAGIDEEGPVELAPDGWRVDRPRTVGVQTFSRPGDEVVLYAVFSRRRGVFAEHPVDRWLLHWVCRGAAGATDGVQAMEAVVAAVRSGPGRLAYAAGSQPHTLHDPQGHTLDDLSLDGLVLPLLQRALSGQLPALLYVSCAGMAQVLVVAGHALGLDTRRQYLFPAWPVGSPVWLNGGPGYRGGAEHQLASLGERWFDLAVESRACSWSPEGYRAEIMTFDQATPVDPRADALSTWQAFFRGSRESMRHFRARLPGALASAFAVVATQLASFRLEAAFHGGARGNVFLVHRASDDALYECTDQHARGERVYQSAGFTKALRPTPFVLRRLGTS